MLRRPYCIQHSLSLSHSLTQSITLRYGSFNIRINSPQHILPIILFLCSYSMILFEQSHFPFIHKTRSFVLFLKLFSTLNLLSVIPHLSLSPLMRRCFEDVDASLFWFCSYCFLMRFSLAFLSDLIQHQCYISIHISFKPVYHRSVFPP